MIDKVVFLLKIGGMNCLLALLGIKKCKVLTDTGFCC